MRPGSKLTRYGKEFIICEPSPALYKSTMVQNVRERGDYFAVNLSTGVLTIFMKADVEGKPPVEATEYPFLSLKAGSYEWPISLRHGTEKALSDIRQCMSLANVEKARITYRNRHRDEWYVDYSVEEKVLDQFYLDIKRKLSN